MRTAFWVWEPHVKRALCKPRRRGEFDFKMDNTVGSCKDVSGIKFSGFGGTVF
jgi:hypothetical protein